MHFKSINLDDYMVCLTGSLQKLTTCVVPNFKGPLAANPNRF